MAEHVESIHGELLQDDAFERHPAGVTCPRYGLVTERIDHDLLGAHRRFVVGLDQGRPMGQSRCDVGSFRDWSTP